MRVPFSFLTEQFEHSEPIFERIREFLKRCDFTLGEDLEVFEKRFAEYCNADFAIGVASGTDAIALALKAVGVGPGHEVITVPNSFVATSGAILQIGAKPVFVDIGSDLNMDCDLIESAITDQTRVILPVHWAGRPAQMERICSLAKKNNLIVIEDACQALGARIGSKRIGTFGVAAAFSLHPIKPLHVWGDGGVVVTNSPDIYKTLKMVRNHGLESRDVVRVFGMNSRMDSLQAIVGNYVFDTLDSTIETRIRYANRYNKAFLSEKLSRFLSVPKEAQDVRHVYHLYQIRVEARDELLLHLKENGIEAKVHYPIPIHLQPAAASWGFKKGSFPNVEDQSDHTITLPAHQFLREEHIDYVIDCIEGFYKP